MATTCGIFGKSGSGKSTGIKTLDPLITFIINSDKKDLPFRDWKKRFNKENKNYIKTSDFDKAKEILSKIDKDQKHFKVVVIDTLNAFMIDSEMVNMKKKGFDKWMDLAFDVYELVTFCNSLRDDLIIFLIFHAAELKDDSGNVDRKILTNGRKLEKIQLETKLPIVLFANCEGSNGENKHFFETRANNSTAKSPEGMFQDFKINNDLHLVVQAIQNY